MYKVRTLRKKSVRNPSAANKLKLEDAEELIKMSNAKSMYESRQVEEYAFNRNNKIFTYIMN